eukprot:TRINITY_DN32955_c0_g1_i1.p1 TRINITY_DN32955_c0_g1~~TRINITY_DN32955_c0_g1_i1.p1  ORF type:complete len:118 (-),score=4.57 TRINITY_DN32955_c0_g1_i1:600-953(-)
MASRRNRALVLYRNLIRASRTWPGPEEEKRYILDEARTSFRRDRNIEDPASIDKKLFEGESRMEIGWHYLIPYPRPWNLPPGSVTTSKISQMPSLHMGGDGDEEDDNPILSARKRRH